MKDLHASLFPRVVALVGALAVFNGYKLVLLAAALAPDKARQDRDSDGCPRKRCALDSSAGTSVAPQCPIL